ncbi:MAG: hypothetical protein WA347_07035 [Rhabdochlamydiaceae bacterium]|jgi:hypothetical protein
MLSVILYGRNDDHGYNYPKRIATSLNCIATMLSDPQDEILFADYNSSDELPTVVEAIQDTLTDRARDLLRILRIRPAHHQQYLGKTSLPLLESVARNAAIRRSNPANKWILSTNNDMIFVPVHPHECLTSVVSELPDGFYTLPRFELPERFWEQSLERSHPEKNISFLRAQERRLHLNMVVRMEGFLKYDNPGDFQLMLRKDIFQIRGFDERMLKKWHIDSNLCKRMSLLYGAQSQALIEEQIMAFHCNHMQKGSESHHLHAENDWNIFVNNPAITAVLPSQNWGLLDETIEEIDLDNKAQIDAIAPVLEPGKEEHFLIHLDSFNRLTYSSSRIFVYLVDHLYHLPKSTIIAYVGYNQKLLQMLTAYLDTIQFTGKILCPRGFINEPLPGVVMADDHISQASICIFDFGFDKTCPEEYASGREKIKKVMQSFFKIIKQLKQGTKCIGINVTHTDFKTIFTKHLSMRINSYITGISYGYLERRRSHYLPIKKRVISAIHYFIVRYFFNYSDPIRSFISRTRLLSYFKKM